MGIRDHVGSRARHIITVLSYISLYDNLVNSHIMHELHTGNLMPKRTAPKPVGSRRVLGSGSREQ